MTVSIKMQCPKCSKDFGSEEALEMHTQAKHSEPYKEPLLSDKSKKRIRNWTIVLVIIALLIGVPTYFYLTSEILPPTSSRGHSEATVSSHVLRQPMGIMVQMHMLEHADGEGPASVIINYNCNDFNCDEDLIENLEAFGAKYPANVYVAPFPKMTAKIALTAEGRMDLLEGYDAQRIEGFIRSVR